MRRHSTPGTNNNMTGNKNKKHVVKRVVESAVVRTCLDVPAAVDRGLECEGGGRGARGRTVRGKGWTRRSPSTKTYLSSHCCADGPLLTGALSDRGSQRQHGQPADRSPLYK